MRQAGNALRKLIRSLAEAGFWRGEAKGERQDMASKPVLLQPARATGTDF